MLIRYDQDGYGVFSQTEREAVHSKIGSHMERFGIDVSGHTDEQKRSMVAAIRGIGCLYSGPAKHELLAGPWK